MASFEHTKRIVSKAVVETRPIEELLPPLSAREAEQYRLDLEAIKRAEREGIAYLSGHILKGEVELEGSVLAKRDE